MGLKDRFIKAGSSRNFLKDKLKISFCTTCMNRVDYLRHTLKFNLNASYIYNNIFDFEFVLVNYNSIDKTDEFVTNDLKRYMESGLLKYYVTRDPVKFHMSHAKNVAHKCATGDILINIDSDIYILGGLIDFVKEKFTDKKVVIGSNKKGTYGVIAVSREAFHILRGYDENFVGWSPEDSDFMYRARRLGGSIYNWPNDVLYHIDHPSVLRGYQEENVKRGDTLKKIHEDFEVIDVNERGYGECNFVL